MTMWKVLQSNIIYDIDEERIVNYSDCKHKAQLFMPTGEYSDSIIHQVNQLRRQPMAIAQSDGHDRWIRVLDGIIPFCDGCESFFKVNDIFIGCCHIAMCSACSSDIKVETNDPQSSHITRQIAIEEQCSRRLHIIKQKK